MDEVQSGELSEALLRAVFDAAHDGLVMIDAGGTIEAVNPAAGRIFGWAPAELRGRSVRELMPEPYRAEHDGYIGRYLRTGERRIIGIGREVVGRRRDGSTFPMDLALSEFVVEGERRFLGLIRDISGRKAEDQARAALAAREATQRGRSELAAGILHDVGNVLSGIGARLGSARALLDERGAAANLRRTIAFLRGQEAALERAIGAKAGALLHMLTTIAEASEGREGQVSDDVDKALTFLSHAQEVLTTYRRYSGAGSSPTRERLAIDRLLVDAQLMTADALTKRGGAIHVHCERGLPEILTERAKVMQLLLNLLKNAVEALDCGERAGAPQIDLSAHQRGGQVIVEVRDNGCGFGPEVGARAFEDGFSTKERGSGIGLASCRRIARTIGAEITLESEGPGQGACARLSLPIEEPGG